MKLTEIIEVESHTWLDMDIFFKQPIRELNIWRTRLREQYKRNKDKPLMVCAWCNAPVTLARWADHSFFFFKHIPEVENESSYQCPVKTKGKLSSEQINALKYMGAKESVLHRQLKQNIVDSLLADQKFSNIQVEKIRKSIDLSSWRKPDVTAELNSQLIVFEGQLSTTFLSVIIDRKIFYQDNNACLIWIFDHFEPTEKLIKQSMQDIYFNNNANAFVVNQHTVLASQKAGVFLLQCHYLEPYLQSNKILHRWITKIVPIHELEHNRATGQIYYFNHAFEYEKLKNAIGVQKSFIQDSHNIQKKLAVEQYHQKLNANTLDENQKIKIKEVLVYQFEDLWKNAFYYTDQQFKEKWLPIRNELVKLAISVPEWITHSPYKTVINSILSAKYGYAFATKLPDLISVAHILMEHHPEYVTHFLLVLKYSGHAHLLSQQDNSQKWETKRKKYAEDANKLHFHDMNEFIEFLVPKLEGRLISWGKTDKSSEN